MALVGMTGRKATLTIQNGGSATDVLDLGLQTADNAVATVVMQKGSANGNDLILLRGQAITVVSIQSVVQGSTTYTGGGTDYQLTTNGVDWSPGGVEPATNSFYTVTFTYTKDAPGSKSYRRWDIQIISTDSALTGTVNPQISDTPTTPGNFRNMQSGGSDIAITANKATGIIPCIGRFLMLKSSGTEGGTRTFIVMLSTITDDK